MLRNKIEYLNEKVKEGMFEREEVIGLSFLAMLSGESVFMLGLPGVAKSMIARRMKNTLKGAKNFEYLMNRFSSPEEIYGPISLKKLDEDKYERVVDGYMPTADIAFLDEIWKASPSIQNTLLTIINEKIFRNGSEDISVPLKLLIAASNELPASGEGLEALYDRFLIRYYVDPIAEKSNFNKLMRNASELSEIDEKMKLTPEELSKAKEDAEKLNVDDETLVFIHEFRKRLRVEMKEKEPYISDRRWKKIINLLRMNAYVSGRKSVEIIDLPIIIHAIWETQEQRVAINAIFYSMWYNYIGRKTGVSIDEVEKAIATAKELNDKGFIYSKTQYKLVHKSQYNSVKYDYYCYKMTNNSGLYVYIPVENGEPASDNGSYTRVYYSQKQIKAITNNVSSENWNTDKINLNNNTFNGNYTLEPKMVEIKKYDIKKLEEAKNIVDSNGMLIYKLKSDFEVKLNEVKSQESFFVQSFELLVEKAGATVLDRINKANSDNNTMLGKVVNNIKIANEE